MPLALSITMYLFSILPEYSSATNIKKQECNYHKFSETNVYDIGYYTGSADIILSGFIINKRNSKLSVFIDSQDFISIIGTNTPESEITNKAKEFRTNGTTLSMEKLNSLKNSKIFVQNKNKLIEKEIANRTALRKYFKSIGNGQYSITDGPEKTGDLYTELLRQQILIRTGGYTGLPTIECK